ncbi:MULTISPECIES: HPr family phosphocarrier protein [Bacillaceae]|uniref:HPr family phosphocarrier protein n=1 Tax=Evansella alkalicola TaxID=745819 RepID=A0ABS6JWE8_9BACI|nr:MULTISPECIES: HPr family phosphocarrier protein [Bacillaceae]MBU9722557.1 HPr family phosphocarrier protein [Bacillus alkalicola]
MKLTVQRPIFAESASKFVNAASKYSSTILIKKDHWVVDAKSLLGVLALSLQPDDVVELSFEGNESESEEFTKEVTELGLFG